MTVLPKREVVGWDNCLDKRVLFSLSRKDLHQEVIVPTATATSHGHTVFITMLLQERETGTIEPGEILSQVPLSNPRMVLAIERVKYPMAAVFHSPIAANGPGEILYG